MYFDCPSNPNTARMLDILETFGIQQAVSQATHQRGHILDCVRMLRFCLVKHGPIMLVFSAILMSLAQNSSLCSSLIYPLTTTAVGAPHMISKPVSSISPVLYCPLGLGELQACPFLDVVFPTLSLSALSSSPFHCALQDGFGKT